MVQIDTDFGAKRGLGKGIEPGQVPTAGIAGGVWFDQLEANRQTDLERMVDLDESLAEAERYAASKGTENPAAFLMVFPRKYIAMTKGSLKITPPRALDAQLKGMAKSGVRKAA